MPDEHPNGWSVRDVLAEIDKRNDARFSGSDRLTEQRFSDMRADLAERDLRYQQRFDAQEKAVRDALAAAKEAVTAALTAADRAVGKAEDAATKRFDSVNEFRGQLADQAASLMPRAEYMVQHAALVEKVDDSISRADARFAGITTSLTALTANQIGSNATGDKYRSTLLAALAVLMSLGAIVAVIVTAH